MATSTTAHTATPDDVVWVTTNPAGAWPPPEPADGPGSVRAFAAAGTVMAAIIVLRTAMRRRVRVMVSSLVEVVRRTLRAGAGSALRY
jgi:hypothetical protein